MDGFGDQYHDTQLNKDCTEHRMAHFWLGIHKLIYTILQLVFALPEKRYTIVLNLSTDIGKFHSNL